MEERDEKKGRKEMEEGNEKEMEEKNDGQRKKAIDRVTIGGSIVNGVLLIFKFVAGVLGGSAAMIADAVHSLSDFVTDLVVLVFIRLSGKPQDKGHDYGHGKYETLATALIGGMLLAVGVMICVEGVSKIWDALHGVVLPQPGWIALVAALLSVVSKEWCYRFTVRVGRRYQSSVVVANAWHHRSDALSSVGTSVGIGGAILLGDQWTILDPLTAVAVSGFIVWEAVRLIRESVGDLLEASLPDEVEQQISRLVCEEPGRERTPQPPHAPHWRPLRYRNARPHAGRHDALRGPSPRHGHRTEYQARLRILHPRHCPPRTAQGKWGVCGAVSVRRETAVYESVSVGRETAVCGPLT